MFNFFFFLVVGGCLGRDWTGLDCGCVWAGGGDMCLGLGT